MSVGRHDVDFEGVDIDVLPFKIDNSTITYDPLQAGYSAAVGLAVKLSADRTVALVQDGDPVFGKLLKVEADGFCSVQYGGGCDLPAGASATVTAGSKIVGALGASSARGYIRNAAVAAGTYAQAAATESLKGQHTILDASVTTKVMVLLCD